MRGLINLETAAVKRHSIGQFPAGNVVAVARQSHWGLERAAAGAVVESTQPS